VAWFMNGKLNASVCCIDQHLATRADQVTEMT
jgi:acyl-coenzyme A synthetase/AMP-(fatty) acid ligase